jgi:hypothetical protein
MNVEKKQEAIDALWEIRGEASRILHIIRKIPDPIGVNIGEAQRAFNSILSDLGKVEHIISKEE